jgi:hypothetical protein
VGDWIFLTGLIVPLGAVVLTRFGLREYVPEADPEDDLSLS